MIRAGLCRNEVNKRTRHIVRAFKWAVESELVPPGVHQGVKSVAGLRKGRSHARESEPAKPVPDAHVDAIAPHVSRQVWAMVQLQRLTGMRPGEVTIMRTRDIDMLGNVSIYRPESHKTEHHGKEREIPLGPRAQAVLKPWLRADSAAYLFSPREVLARISHQ
jgi:integrase